MNKSQKYQWGFVVLFALSLILRLGLALVNREANDDHLEVVHIIMETNHLPNMNDCKECFHPKFFYATAALLLKSLGVDEVNTQIIFLQLVNLCAGAITLVVINKFIKEYPSTNEPLKLVAFALIALNPKFIAINSQVSNDTFTILFSTLALYFAYHFLQKSNQKDFWLLVFFILLAVSTKVTAWVIFIAIFLSCLLALWVRNKKGEHTLTYVLLLPLAVFILTTLNPLSEFVSNYQTFGTPIVNSRNPLPLPDIFQKTVPYEQYDFRPGIVSIQDGFFTFKLIDLLNYPLINNAPEDYPPQRTSFWTMLYADVHSLRFRNWPPSWRTKGDNYFFISRGIFILALLPTLIFVVGLLFELFTFLKALLTRDKPKIRTLGNGLFLLTSGGYLAFLMLTALLYRDYAFVKFVYILPGLLAYTWIFLQGADLLVSRFRWGQWLLIGWTTALLAFYCREVFSMITQLYSKNIHL